MKTLIILAIAAVGFCAGCCNSQKTSSLPQTAASTPQHKTVEFVQNSDMNIPERVDQWNHEGWKVLSISKPLPQPDGTVLRRAELER